MLTTAWPVRRPSARPFHRGYRAGGRAEWDSAPRRKGYGSAYRGKGPPHGVDTCTRIYYGPPPARLQGTRECGTMASFAGLSHREVRLRPAPPVACHGARHYGAAHGRPSRTQTHTRAPRTCSCAQTRAQTRTQLTADPHARAHERKHRRTQTLTPTHAHTQTHTHTHAHAHTHTYPDIRRTRSRLRLCWSVPWHTRYVATRWKHVSNTLATH
jgi:hypothetical protein